MQLALVVGTTHASIKHATMQNTKLLIVQPITTVGSPDGEPLLAVDTVGAGVGQQVMITSDGRYSRQWLKADATPVRYTTIGIKDE
jgi:ethanolamine utilization protein EutN